VAQIAITALSLDNLSSAHWTAKAAFVISLAAGALSVFFACLLQQRISSLFSLSDLKDWLSKPTTDQQLDETADFVRLLYGRMPRRHTKHVSSTERNLWTEVEKRVLHKVDTLRWERASVHAALMIKIPALLLNWSVGAFLIGLGIYLGSFWIRRLDPSQTQSSSLGVLIVYIVITGVGLLLFFVSVLLKYLEGVPIRILLERLKGRTSNNGAEEDADKVPVTEGGARAQIKRLGARYFNTQTKSRKRPEMDPVDFISCLFPEIEQLRRAEQDHQQDLEANRHSTAPPQPSTSAPDGVPAPPDADKAAVEDEPRSSVDGRSPSITSPDYVAVHNSTSTHFEHAADSSTGEASTKQSRKQTDPMVAALEASILAQEQSIASFRALLQEHQKLRGV
jgi:hypothetical protein